MDRVKVNLPECIGLLQAFLGANSSGIMQHKSLFVVVRGHLIILHHIRAPAWLYED